MTITAPITIETQHDDIEIIEDVIEVVESTQPVAATEAYSMSLPDRQLIPFLVLGVMSWIGIVIAATLLTF